MTSTLPTSGKALYILLTLVLSDQIRSNREMKRGTKLQIKLRDNVPTQQMCTQAVFMCRIKRILSTRLSFKVDETK